MPNDADIVRKRQSPKGKKANLVSEISDYRQLKHKSSCLSQLSASNSTLPLGHGENIPRQNAVLRALMRLKSKAENQRACQDRLPHRR